MSKVDYRFLATSIRTCHLFKREEKKRKEKRGQEKRGKRKARLGSLFLKT